MIYIDIAKLKKLIKERNFDEIYKIKKALAQSGLDPEIFEELIHKLENRYLLSIIVEDKTF